MPIAITPITTAPIITAPWHEHAGYRYGYAPHHVYGPRYGYHMTAWHRITTAIASTRSAAITDRRV
jgi:hypothetical protein